MLTSQLPPFKLPSLPTQMPLRSAHASDLPSMDRESIEVLIAAGEWAVALETLCTQLYEYDLEPSAEERAQLEALGRELDVPVRYLLGDPWAGPEASP